MGAMSRNKGAAGEREFAKLLGGLLGVELKRNLEQCRSGGHDLSATESGVLDRWSIEVKRAKAPRLSEWWAQAEKQAEETERMPLLAYRLDNQKWRVMVHAADVDGLGLMPMADFQIGDGIGWVFEMSPELFASMIKAQYG